MSEAQNIVLKDGSQSGTFFAVSSDLSAKASASAEASAKEGSGLQIKRFFTKEGVHPYDAIKWERRDAKIATAKGEVIFEQKDVEVPKSWSQTATDIVAEKYFAGHIGKAGRETSVKQLIGRVADTIAGWGSKDGYFATDKDSQIFNEELKYLLVNQKASFNSPVWFNVGIQEYDPNAGGVSSYRWGFSKGKVVS